MSQASGTRAPSNQMRLSQLALLGARNAAKVVARKLNANVDYDLRMYEAIRELRPWSAQDVVFDVGANDGRTIFRLMRHLPAPRIFAFEPASATFGILTERTAALDNVECHQLAMGAECGQQTMYLSERSVLNSLYPDWGRNHGVGGNVSQTTESVRISTLDEFAARQAISRIHLLKIDVEGHDLEVLKGAEETLRNGHVDIIQVEAGFAVPGRQQPSLEEFQKYLARYDYYLYGIYNQCRSPFPLQSVHYPADHSVPHILVFCDALFVGPDSAALPGSGR